MHTELLRIGELADHCGVSRRTIDYYTSLGLIRPAARTDGNFRLYDPRAIHHVELIQRLEAQGIPLDDITSALTGPAPDRSALIDRVETALTRLRTIEANTDPDTDRLAGTALERAHSLVTLAVDIIAALAP